MNDTRFFFDVEGAKLVPDGPTMREKPTLVLLHGGPGADHSMYKPTFSAFADIAQVIYLDLRGQGRSAPSDLEQLTLATWADFEDPGPETQQDYGRLCMPLYLRFQEDPDRFRRIRLNPELCHYFDGHELKTMDFLPDLARVACPTLVLAGEEDPITPFEDAKDVVSAMPAHLVRLETLADPRRHGISDAPEQTLQIVREFILDDGRETGGGKHIT